MLLFPCLLCEKAKMIFFLGLARSPSLLQDCILVCIQTRPASRKIQRNWSVLSGNNIGSGKNFLHISFWSIGRRYVFIMNENRWGSRTKNRATLQTRRVVVNPRIFLLLMHRWPDYKRILLHSWHPRFLLVLNRWGYWKRGENSL